MNNEEKILKLLESLDNRLGNVEGGQETMARQVNNLTEQVNKQKNCEHVSKM